MSHEAFSEDHTALRRGGRPERARPVRPDVVDQHEAVGAELRRLEQLLEDVEKMSYQSWLGELHRWFDDFVPVLEGHFRNEERTSFYASIAEQEERFQRKILRLRSEHAELLTELFRIQRELLPTAAEPLLGELWDIAHRIRVHDAEESEVLSPAYLEDAHSAEA